MSCICCVYTIHILTKILWYTNYNIGICHVYVVYILYIYWLKYFDMPCICCVYTIHVLTICFVRDLTKPQVSTLCSWSSNISACLDRQPIWRGSILLLSMTQYVWQLQPFWRGHSAQPGFLQPLWGTSLEDSWNHGIKRNSQGVWALTCSHTLRWKGWGPPRLSSSHSMLSGRKCNLNYST